MLPRDLTQKAPNKGKVAKEVNVEDLKPRPASPGAAASRAGRASVQTAESAAARSIGARGAAHRRASENRDAAHGAEYSAFAARVGRHAESSAARRFSPWSSLNSRLKRRDRTVLARTRGKRS